MVEDIRIHGYARVSSKDQNEIRQLISLKDFGVLDRDIYVDKATGKDFNRQEYQRMLNCIRKGDLLVICSIDRLGRNYSEIREQWRTIIVDLGADIKVLDMPLLDTRVKEDSIDRRFVSDLVLQILSYVAEKERINIKARQAQGISAAKAQGKVLGRPKAQYPVNWKEVYTLWNEKKVITAKEAMKRLGLARNTFYKLAKKYNYT